MAQLTTSGYSGTPLWKKLGIARGARVYLSGAPSEYRRWLEPIPDAVRFQNRVGPSTDVAHVFVTKRSILEAKLASLRRSLRSDAAVWVSWPKKTARVETDVTESVIRECALPMGFVDVKVCAVTEVWSGLKLVVRVGLR